MSIKKSNTGQTHSHTHTHIHMYKTYLIHGAKDQNRIQIRRECFIVQSTQHPHQIHIWKREERKNKSEYIFVHCIIVCIKSKRSRRDDCIDNNNETHAAVCLVINLRLVMNSPAQFSLARWWRAVAVRFADKERIHVIDWVTILTHWEIHTFSNANISHRYRWIHSILCASGKKSLSVLLTSHGCSLWIFELSNQCIQ